MDATARTFVIGSPVLQTLKRSGEGLRKGLSDHVGIDRPQIARDGRQELIIREQGG